MEYALQKFANIPLRPEERSALMERIWIIISILCLIVAAFFWLGRGNLDAAFVAATLGLVAWFLSLRNRLRRAGIEHGDTNFEDESNLNQDEN